jgi:redox-sensitive bicupin YhaK (pirin superfamily)
MRRVELPSVSNLDPKPAVAVVGGTDADGPSWEELAPREVVLGGTRAKGTDGLPVARVLPTRTRRMVGAWCFLDHFDGVGAGMMVAPHPHTGLQTVTWLLDGAVQHRDSLGNTQLIRPGQLNLMTAGRGIAHAETSPDDAPPSLHGVQLWVALPDDARGGEPGFEHLPELPTVTDGGARVRVLAGELAGVTSPARIFSPLVGAEITLAAGSRLELPLQPEFEYAMMGLTGGVTLDGREVESGPLVYLGRGRATLELTTTAPVTALLLGGEPFGHKIVMWWNFIGRSHEEIVADREDWMAGRRFPTVVGYDGPALPAPPLPMTPLLPR